MRILIPCLACLLFAVPAAFAQTAPPPDASQPAPPATAPMRHHEPIWTLDTNHDGMISRDEAQSRPGLMRHFDQIDTNRDGQLDREEIRAWHRQMKARKAERMQPQSPPSDSSGQPTTPPPPAPEDDGSGNG